MKTNDSIRVRYGRKEKRVPKNTLVTMRVENKIYFGIARCKNKMDTFKRDVGTNIATGRVMLATFENCEGYLHAGTNNNMYVHPNHLRGVVTVEDIHELLDYFNRIDDICLRGDK
jgi:hypothetical protein